MALFRRHTAEDYEEQAGRRLREHDYPGSLAAADRAIELAPGLAMAYHHRGWALSELGRPVEALTATDVAIDVTGDDTAPWILRGAILFEFERYDDAVAGFDEALRLVPGMTAAREQRDITLAQAHEAQ